MRGVDVGDVGVVSLLPRPERDSRRAAQCGCAKMTFVRCASLDEMFFDKREVVEGVQM